MEIEKTIRNQAKNKLENNWVGAVSALFVLFGFAVALILLFESLINIFKVYDNNGELKESSVATLILILFFTVAAGVFISPVKNGFLKYFYDLSNTGEGDLMSVFYFFFRIKRYFKTILFNLILIGIFILNMAITLLPYGILKIIDNSVDIFSTVEAEQVGYIIYSILFGIGITAGIVLSLRLIFVEFLYIDNENKEAGYYFGKKATKLSIKHHKDYIILVFTFLPWIMLCFFVLPALYVIPYLSESLATSSKWLIKLNKDGQNL
ncbi:MAG: hypothetical protein ACI4HO_04785 [Ruminococcus sp.]